MPSLRSILLGISLITLSAAAPAAAPGLALADCPRPSGKAAPTIPASGNPTELPTTTLALQHVAIGRGVQNYTCVDATTPPVLLGAVATLFDATNLAYVSTNALHMIPPMSVYLPLPPTSFASTAGILRVLGHHYFDDKGTPVFDLSSVRKILFVAKAAAVNAPATANKGPAGTGAVAWLQLTSKVGYTSVGASMVYRVVTAGGNPPAACTKPGVISIPYAAEYWFYN